MPPDVKSAFEGESGILAGLTEGKIWIDHSTTDFEQTQQFNERVRVNKIRFCIHEKTVVILLRNLKSLKLFSKGQFLSLDEEKGHRGLGACP